MKFSVNREVLLKPLQQVAGVVERRQTLPVLSNVLIQVTDAGVSLTGTDLEVELIGQVATENAELGEITVPAKKLLDICKELPDKADVVFELLDSRLLIKSGRFKSNLSTLPAADFPSVDRSAVEMTTTINSKSFKKLLDRTSFAMAQQDVRYFLNGMLLELGDGYIRSVATDGHRLAMSSLSQDSNNGTMKQVIIPRKGVLELQRLLGDLDGEIEVSFGANHLCARSDNFTMTTKLVDGRFPDYDRVIPKNGDK
ncbi:MAG: DNA polymerase-3 subunit beta, partial [Candidatus Azotimanducaceae bacterium]